MIMAEENLSKSEKKKQKKKQKAERKKYIREIKAVLMGNVKRGEDNKLIAGKAHLVTRWGVGDGAKETMILGVHHKKFLYDTTYNNPKQALYQAEEALKDLGLRVYLECEPDAVVCFIKAILFRPVVIMLKESNDEDHPKQEDKQPMITLTAFCGRAFTTFFSIKRVVSRFEKQMGDRFIRLK